MKVVEDRRVSWCSARVCFLKCARELQLAVLTVRRGGGQNGLLLTSAVPLPDATQISLIEDGESTDCSNEVFYIVYNQ